MCIRDRALVDISADEGWLSAALKVMQLIQMCVQGHWLSECSLLTLPHFEDSHIVQLNQSLTSSRRQLSWQCGVKEIATLPELIVVCKHDRNFLKFSLGGVLSADKLKQVSYVIKVSLNKPHANQPYEKKNIHNMYVGVVMCLVILFLMMRNPVMQCSCAKLDTALM